MLPWREGIAFANFDRCNDLILERMGEIFWYQQREDGKVSSSISFFSKWNYTKDVMDMNTNLIMEFKCKFESCSDVVLILAAEIVMSA